MSQAPLLKYGVEELQLEPDAAGYSIACGAFGDALRWPQAPALSRAFNIPKP